MRSCRFVVAAAGMFLAMTAGCNRSEPIAAAPAAPAVGDPQKPPQIQISRAERDLGEITLEQHVETFEVRNIGQQPLKISSLGKSCGCIEAKISKSTIEGGKVERLEVTVEPRQSEERSASLTVHSNDPAAESTRIVLTWTARGPVSVEPKKLAFGTIRPDIAASQTLRVKQDLSQLAKEIELRVSGRPHGLFTAKRVNTSRVKDAIDEEWSISLVVDVETVESTGDLTLAESRGARPLMSVPVSWLVREEINAAPSSLFLGAEQPSHEVRRTIDVTCDAGKTLKVNRVEHEGTHFSVEISMEVVSPELTRIELAAVLPEKPGTYLEHILIECSEPFASTLKLPLSCVVQNPPVMP